MAAPGSSSMHVASFDGGSSSAGGTGSVERTDGTFVTIAQVYSIVNHDAPSPADRTIKFVSDNAKALDYHTKNITDLGKDVLGIKLLRDSETTNNEEDEAQNLAAQISFPEPNNEHIIANLGCSAGALKIVDSTGKADEKSAGHNAKHIELRGLPEGQSLFWRSTEGYIHAAKDKSRAGDFELVGTDVQDGTERILAVFLNRWDGDRAARDVGTLQLTEEGSAQAIAEIAIASFAVLGDHFSKRKRDYLFHSLETSALACCVQ